MAKDRDIIVIFGSNPNEDSARSRLANMSRIAAPQTMATNQPSFFDA
jgi:hypothetical protein